MVGLYRSEDWAALGVLRAHLAQLAGHTSKYVLEGRAIIAYL